MRIFKAVEVANQAAGDGDGEWNKRWIKALNGEGFDLARTLPTPDHPSMTPPKPYPSGWSYPYPSVVVEMKR